MMYVLVDNEEDKEDGDHDLLDELLNNENEEKTQGFLCYNYPNNTSAMIMEYNDNAVFRTSFQVSLYKPQP